jgi:predicted anti-sigma-YlaC factor YlaD
MRAPSSRPAVAVTAARRFFILVQAIRVRDPGASRDEVEGCMQTRLAAMKPGLAVLAGAAMLSACSLKTMAVNTMADALAASGDVYASDDDPALVRDALPFSLKTIESFLAGAPRHPGLLLTACSGFTQYSYAFVQSDADMLDASEYPKAQELRDRALKLYLRARDYCLRRLELAHAGIGVALVRSPGPALAAMRRDEVGQLYWTGASWGAAISLGLDRPELVNAVPAVRALMERALALDETYSRGAIHEALITLDSLPEALGGSPDRARQHFERAVALQKGRSPGPYVALAMGVSVASQNRAEFERLMQEALAIDPEQDRSNRLATILAQRSARRLLERADELFSGSDHMMPAWFWSLRMEDVRPHGGGERP